MILLTADIHIKLGQKNVPKDWSINRFRELFNQINEAENQHNVTTTIIPGDIFDKIPTLEELNLFFEFIISRKTKTILSTGNHEAVTKKESFFKYLKAPIESINPLVQVVLEPTRFDGFHVIPYEYIKKEDMWKSLEILPVFTHIRGEIPPYVSSEIPLEWLDKFPIVFAGDLHSHSNTQKNIVYPGSPITTSFHRELTDTGYIIIDPDTWNWKWHKFSLPQLIRLTVTDKADMVPTDYHHTIYELSGNLKDISRVSNELLDKKLIKKKSDVALVLNPEYTMVEELVEYLLYIQELEQEEVDKILEVFNEHSSN